MTTNLFVIANVKQLRTGGSFRILLPFFRIFWGVGDLNSAIFLTVFKIGLNLEGLRNFGGGGRVETPPHRYATGMYYRAQWLLYASILATKRCPAICPRSVFMYFP